MPRLLEVVHRGRERGDRDAEHQLRVLDLAGLVVDGLLVVDGPVEPGQDRVDAVAGSLRVRGVDGDVAVLDDGSAAPRPWRRPPSCLRCPRRSATRPVAPGPGRCCRPRPQPAAAVPVAPPPLQPLSATRPRTPTRARRGRVRVMQVGRPGAAGGSLAAAGLLDGRPSRPCAVLCGRWESGAVSERPDVVVVGGGVAGLVAARDLSGSGLSVLLLESSPVVGGKLRLHEVGGVRVDVGAESMLARRPEAVGLVAELGLDVVHPAAGSAQIWTRGALRPLPRTVLGVPLELDALATSGVLSDDGLARARAETVLPLGPADVSVAELLGSRLGHEVVDRLADPMLGGVYAGHADHLSAAATVPQVVAMVREHGSLLAAAAALPPPPPSPPPMFAGLVGGIGRLPLALAETDGVRGPDLGHRPADRAHGLGVPAHRRLDPRARDRRDRPGRRRRPGPTRRAAPRRRGPGGVRGAGCGRVRVDGGDHDRRAGARRRRLVGLPGPLGGRPADQGVDVLLQQVGAGSARPPTCVSCAPRSDGTARRRRSRPPTRSWSRTSSPTCRSRRVRRCGPSTRTSSAGAVRCRSTPSVTSTG